jgi:hypothetical protein
MTDKDATPKTAGDADTSVSPMEPEFRRSMIDDAGNEGWALRWDTSALRKVNLARRMRDLREGSNER